MNRLYDRCPWSSESLRRLKACIQVAVQIMLLAHLPVMRDDYFHALSFLVSRIFSNMMRIVVIRFCCRRTAISYCHDDGRTRVLSYPSRWPMLYPHGIPSCVSVLPV